MKKMKMRTLNAERRYDYEEEGVKEKCKKRLDARV